jgi:glucose/mannose-6-phosphate isomerase
LINENLLKKVDSSEMYKVYDKWPEIARQYYEEDFINIDFGEITHVVFAGMGGSGTIGDIFSAILSKTNIHVEVVKGYLLPKTVDSKSLVVAISVSGNTEETLNVLDSASKIKCKIIAFSNGGKMQKFCNDKGLNYRKISMMHSPRASFPAFLFSILKILESFLPIEKNDIINALEELEKLRNEIASSNLNKKNPSIELAKLISGIPLIYYPWGLQAAAIRFKNSLQENAKMHAITEDIIESCHNGIVPWDKKTDVKPILIQGTDDYTKTKERWNIIKGFFDMKNIHYVEINSIDSNIFSKLINLIYLLDYSTIYRAILSGIDPTPVNSIDYIKSKI